MRKAILCIIFFVVVLDAHAENGMVRLPSTGFYWVQPGDTLTGIAGRYFLLVYKNNLEELGSLDLSGKASPNRIVTGTRLKIPGGIWVSPKVARAINVQVAIRQKTLTAIDQAEKGQKALKKLNGSSPRGDNLLEEAKSLIQEDPSYANWNYLQAYEKAVSAEKYFTDAGAILTLQANLKEIEKKIEAQSKEVITEEAPERGVEPNYHRWPMIAGLVALGLVFGAICVVYVMSRLRQRERTTTYIKQRLTHHKNRLLTLSNSCR